MKLQDPGLEALLEAYRDDRQPSETVREQMWQHVDRARRPRRAWVPAAVATAVAVAALVILWLAMRGLSGEVARTRGPGSGAQAPFDHASEPPRGMASTRAERAAASGDPATTELPLDPASPSSPEPSIDDAATSEHASAEPASEPRSRPAPADEQRPTAGSRADTDPTIDPTPPSPGDDLALVEAAEAALRADDPARALELLRRHEQRFPRAVTAEEREALRVLALCAAGRTVEGRGARSVFLREHPRSAYRERIEKACPEA